MKRLLLALPGLVAAACGSPPGPAIALTPADPPLVVPPMDAGVVVARPAAPAKPGVATSDYLELLRAIDTTDATPEREKLARRAAFEKLRELADPRAADGLAAYLERNPKPRWRTEAAITLAALGDLRAVPHLAWRLEQQPSQL